MVRISTGPASVAVLFALKAKPKKNPKRQSTARAAERRLRCDGFAAGFAGELSTGNAGCLPRRTLQRNDRIRSPSGMPSSPAPSTRVRTAWFACGTTNMTTKFTTIQTAVRIKLGIPTCRR